ncbi:hypothetical protein E3N88_19248 [Mikania micrantha]|uniref:UBC core domain-containing protein n=1 Tax=Mikania micrantha TaxID=192012 RepID=A0A5N6NMN9_9ASTR|nr:hypothetical protein E3N88_19248 [Mikania micrantha]
MENRCEELCHRLAGIDVTLKDIKQGINQLVASSQFRTNANGYVDNKNKSVVAEEDGTDGLDNVVKKKRKHTDTSHGSDHPPPPPPPIDASKQIVEVPTKGETVVYKKGSPFFIKEVDYIATFEMHLLEKYKNSPIGPFSILDVLPFESKHRPEAPSLNLEGVMERFGAFKKYDTVSDHSDHFYSAYKLSVRQQKGLEDWSDNLTKEWKAVEEQLPENIFVRAYEGTVNLLRAAIIGPQGTPYHDGLFFFDICFTSNYPKDSPLVHYCYDGLHINPNIRSSGSLFKLFPKRDKGGKLLGLESIWVPGTSDMLSLLIFLRSLFNATPLLNGVHDHVNFCGGRQVMFYNEVVFIKSLKTMVVVMNNPLKHFEDFVVGHFRNHATHILDAFQAYTEGVRVGSIIDGVPADGNQGTFSPTFKDDLATSINPLLEAFKKIGAFVGAEYSPPRLLQSKPYLLIRHDDVAVFMIPNPNIDLSGLALFATKLLIHLWLWAFRNYMKKRYEELSHRLARIEATLKDIKQGINQLVASSQFRTNANGYVDNKNKSIVAEEGMTDSLDDVVKKKGKHTGTSHGPHHPPPPIIASNQMVEVPTKGETMVHIKKSGFVVKNGFEIKTLY